MNNQCGQLKFALTILGIIACLCIASGVYLLSAGYQSGELFVGIAGSIAGAIAGMLSMNRQPGHSDTQPGEITASISATTTTETKPEP